MKWVTYWHVNKKIYIFLHKVIIMLARLQSVQVSNPLPCCTILALKTPTYHCTTPAGHTAGSNTSDPPASAPTPHVVPATVAVSARDRRALALGRPRMAIEDGHAARYVRVRCATPYRTLEASVGRRDRVCAVPGSNTGDRRTSDCTWSNADVLLENIELIVGNKRRIDHEPNV
jgi:hypothetical protein